MPSYKQQLSFPENSAGLLLNLAYGAVLQLGWTCRYSGDNTLVAYTPKSWNNNEQEILIETANNALTVTSSMLHGEAFDITGKNKKNVTGFMEAFAQIRSIRTQPDPAWGEALDKIKEETIVVAKEAEQSAAEVDKIMNLSAGSRYITYGIIGINIIVFLLMAVSGVHLLNPESNDLIRWGANFKPLTMNGEWWRLISCVFVHIGIIHLLFNMYALYSAGVYLEPMLGKIRYISAYLCTGVVASIASLWWHKQNIVSAGASGAIFGMYGVFLALLSTNLIPKQIRKSLLQSIGIFVVYNLVYGMQSGVDNAAHIGGLLSGLATGYLYYLDLGKKVNIGKNVITAGVMLLTIAGTWLFLQKFSDDSVRFSQLFTEYSKQEELALTPLRNTDNMTAAEFKNQLEKNSLPAWNRNHELIQQMEQLRLPDNLKQYFNNLKIYTGLRKEETELLIKAQNEPAGTYDSRLEEISQKLREILKEMEGKG
jgi:rhomboid protease GluP